jgi:hypothetical protein
MYHSSLQNENRIDSQLLHRKKKIGEDIFVLNRSYYYLLNYFDKKRGAGDQ